MYRDAAATFTLRGARHGAVGILPIVPAAIAFGLVYGVVAADRGMTLVQVALCCILIFAGASQLVMADLWQDPLPLGTLVLAVLIINLRHVLMGATAAPWFQGVARWKTYASLYVMTGESWGLAVAGRRRGGTDAAYMLGAGACLWLFWLGSSVAGHGLHGLLHGFDPALFGWLTTAFLVVLLASFWQGGDDLLPWTVAALVALATRALVPGTWFILAGALSGSLLGAWLHVRGR